MATVTLACTLSAGIILRVADENGPAVTLNGWARDGVNQGTTGTAFTSGIDAGLWSTWSAQNTQLTTGTFPAVYLVSEP
jgi:hypothetical protein